MNNSQPPNAGFCSQGNKMQPSWHKLSAIAFNSTCKKTMGRRQDTRGPEHGNMSSRRKFQALWVALNLSFAALRVSGADAATRIASNSPPSITSISPVSGPVGGGTPVTIIGENFVRDTAVNFGGIAAASVTFVSSTQLTATTPAHVAGAVNVTVTNPDTQNSALANGFVFGGAVSVTLLKPARGSTNGGTTVTIIGSGFSSGTTVSFGDAAATLVTFVNTSELTCITPAHSGGGPVDLTVSNPGAASAVLKDGFAYRMAAGPVVKSVSPSSGTSNGGTVIAISGGHFVAGTTVNFGGVILTPTSIASSKLLCVTPAFSQLSGRVDVKVINPDGQTGTLVGGFAYTLTSAPVITKITPNQGLTNGGGVVRLKGLNFARGLRIQFDGADATNITFFTPRFLTCTAPPRSSPGNVAVVVTNPDGASSSINNGYTYKAAHGPLIASVTPNTGPQEGGTTVTVAGGALVPGTVVDFGGVPAQSVTFVSSKELTCVTPANSPGSVAVTVTNPDGQSRSLNHAFLYFAMAPAPSIVSLSPTAGSVFGGTSITINGANFVSGATVTFGSLSATNVVFVSANQLTALTPPNPVGSVDVVVTNPDAQNGTLSNGYIYLTGP